MTVQSPLGDGLDGSASPSVHGSAVHRSASGDHWSAERRAIGRRQRTARIMVGVGLVGAAGLTVVTLVTARGPAPTPAAQFTPATPQVGVASAGLTPAAEPPTTVP